MQPIVNFVIAPGFNVEVTIQPNVDRNTKLFFLAEYFRQEIKSLMVRNQCIINVLSCIKSISITILKGKKTDLPWSGACGATQLKLRRIVN